MIERQDRPHPCPTLKPEGRIPEEPSTPHPANTRGRCGRGFDSLPQAGSAAVGRGLSAGSRAGRSMEVDRADGRAAAGRNMQALQQFVNQSPRDPLPARRADRRAAERGDLKQSLAAAHETGDGRNRCTSTWISGSARAAARSSGTAPVRRARSSTWSPSNRCRARPASRSTGRARNASRARARPVSVQLSGPGRMRPECSGPARASCSSPAVRPTAPRGGPARCRPRGPRSGPSWTAPRVCGSGSR